jgi:hypothetical protein
MKTAGAMVLGVILAVGTAQAQTPEPATTALTMPGLAGWELVSVPAQDIASVCSDAPAGVVAVTGAPVSFIQSTASFRNYRLHAEWRWPGKAGNGGVLVHISSDPKDRQWPLAYQVQLKNGAAGDFLPMAGATFSEPLSTPPGAKTPQLNHSAPDSERPAGDWNSCDIVSVDGTIDVTINGVHQNHVTGCALTDGRVGFQLEGTPFELRNVSIVPIAPPSAPAPGARR